MFKEFCKILEYIPIPIILIYFLSAEECGTHYKLIIYRSLTLMTLWLLFYHLVHNLEMNKNYVFTIMLLLYFITVYVRKMYL